MSLSTNIITIDGPAGSGKSTISRAVAARFSYAYLDTGAMYRAVGLQASLAGIDPQDTKELSKILAGLDLEILPGDGDSRVILHKKDVSLEIRTAEMGMMASKVSAIPVVREKLTEIQQKIGRRGSIVVEGRDMGTVVFPQAKYKFYLDATPEERARRRTSQLEEKGMAADYEQILEQTRKRDYNDSHRVLAPLKPAQDATIIDSSTMTVKEVVEFISKKVTAASL
jgi:cytidylate kinase